MRLEFERPQEILMALLPTSCPCSRPVSAHCFATYKNSTVMFAKVQVVLRPTSCPCGRPVSSADLMQRETAL